MDFTSLSTKDQLAEFQKMDYKDMIRARMSTKYLDNIVMNNRHELSWNPADLCLYIKMCKQSDNSESEPTPRVVFFVKKRVVDPYNQLAGLVFDKIVVFRADGPEDLLELELVPLLKKMGVTSKRLYTSFLTNRSIETLVEVIQPKEISVYHTYKEFDMRTFLDNPLIRERDYLKIGCNGSKAIMYPKGITQTFKNFQEIHLVNLDCYFLYDLLNELKNMSDPGNLRFIHLPVKFDFFCGKYEVPDSTLFWSSEHADSETTNVTKSLKYTSMRVMGGSHKWLVCLERISPFPSTACYRLIFLDKKIGILDRIRSLIKKGFEVESVSEDMVDILNSPVKRLRLQTE